MALSCVAVFLSFHQRKHFIFPCLSTISKQWTILSKRKKLDKRSKLFHDSQVQMWVALQSLSSCLRDLGGFGVASAEWIPPPPMCWPLCGQLGQAPFLRKQSSSGSSPPFVVLPTRWSVEVSVVTEPVCNRLVFHGPVSGLLAGLPEALTRVAAEKSQWKKERQEPGGWNRRVTFTALLRSGLAGRTKLAASHFLAHSSVYAHEG